MEEVLLGGVVERYRPSIQTQQVAQIADITGTPVPWPTELKADIDALENWVVAIRKRRYRPTHAASA